MTTTSTTRTTARPIRIFLIIGVLLLSPGFQLVRTAHILTSWAARRSKFCSCFDGVSLYLLVFSSGFEEHTPRRKGPASLFGKPYSCKSPSCSDYHRGFSPVEKDRTK